MQLNINIGYGTVVAAGAAVTKDVAPNTIASDIKKIEL